MPDRRNPIDRLDPRIRALIAEYVKAEAEMTRLVVGALTSGQLKSKRYRNERRAMMNKMLKSLHAAAIPQARALVRAAYQNGEREALAAIKGKPVSAVKREAIAIATENFEGRLEDGIRTVGRRADDVFRKETLRIVTVESGAGREIDANTLSRQLVERLTKQGITSFTDRAGRNWSLQAYAKMAINTAAGETTNLGVITTMQARGFDLVDVNKVDGACEICKPYEGNTYSLSGLSKEYPHLEKPPPFHPGPCRHFVSVSPHAIADRRARRAA